ncbi:MAG: 16S rRNA (cytosine(1402)-N(4))-methyltransferase RsmH [Lachnospiraceae bacterium]|nr:16S rRNA (cytosine(1402)-N(4))-methyltransferase RsmH [Lachnospiraceae bacterium]
MEFKHTSVLLEETIENLRVKPDGIYIDGTLGGGGHSYATASKLSEKGRLIGIDQDEEAVAAAGKRLEVFGDRVTIIRDNYCNARNVLRNIGIEKVDGIVLDLGVSSYQLDNAERGFSYQNDAALDMRMDTRQALTARDIVNAYPEMELYRIIRDYGEEQFSKNIAKHIVKARTDKPIETTGELNDIIKAAIPAKMRQGGGHPSKRTFQALRIACNRELEVLKDSLDDFIDMLLPGGRICIITFHSLEDRIVKSAFKTNENPCICPPEFPVCTCGRVSKGKVISRKPILPSEEEIEKNKRAKSAKLRVFERSSN